MNTDREYNKKLSDLGYSIKSTLVHDHEFDSDRMADWNCELTGPNGKTVSVEYHTGKVHRKFKGMHGKALPFKPSEFEWSISRATTPDLADLLYCLLLDSSASDQSFDDWCGDLGYDTDSRKALETYLACQNAGSKLRSIGADTACLQTLFENY